MKMFRKCGWCGKHLGTIDKGNPEKITHGICKDCKKMVKKEMEDLLGTPALEPLDTYQLIKH